MVNFVKFETWLISDLTHLLFSISHKIQSKCIKSNKKIMKKTMEDEEE